VEQLSIWDFGVASPEETAGITPLAELLAREQLIFTEPQGLALAEEVVSGPLSSVGTKRPRSSSCLLSSRSSQSPTSSQSHSAAVAACDATAFAVTCTSVTNSDTWARHNLISEVEPLSSEAAACTSSGAKRHTCPLPQCRRSFGGPRGLRLHMKDVHSMCPDTPVREHALPLQAASNAVLLPVREIAGTAVASSALGASLSTDTPAATVVASRELGTDVANCRNQLASRVTTSLSHSAASVAPSSSSASLLELQLAQGESISKEWRCDPCDLNFESPALLRSHM
jgi:hypothetical protein